VHRCLPGHTLPARSLVFVDTGWYRRTALHRRGAGRTSAWRSTAIFSPLRICFASGMRFRTPHAYHTAHLLRTYLHWIFSRYRAATLRRLYAAIMFFARINNIASIGLRRLASLSANVAAAKAVGDQSTRNNAQDIS